MNKEGDFSVERFRSEIKEADQKGKDNAKVFFQYNPKDKVKGELKAQADELVSNELGILEEMIRISSPDSEDVIGEALLRDGRLLIRLKDKREGYGKRYEPSTNDFDDGLQYLKRELRDALTTSQRDVWSISDNTRFDYWLRLREFNAMVGEIRRQTVSNHSFFSNLEHMGMEFYTMFGNHIPPTFSDERAYQVPQDMLPLLDSRGGLSGPLNTRAMQQPDSGQPPLQVGKKRVG